MATILIKQLPDDYADSIGLSKYNRSRLPGTFDSFSAGKNPDGRYVTGIDEKSISVPNTKKEEIKTLRESLEQKTNTDLSGLSKYWEDFQVIIHSDRPRVFNTENPLDIISYNLLIANRIVAPTKDDASTSEFKDAQYYAYTEESEISDEISTRQVRDKAIGALIGISENKEKMLLYGQYLEGIKYTDKLSPANLYKMLRAFIEDKNVNNAKNFLLALNESVEKMQTKAIVDKALKSRLITKVSLGNKQQVFQYGQVTLGTTLEDVYKNLGLPDYAPELLAIQKDLAR